MREYLFQLLESGGGELTGEVILLRLAVSAVIAGFLFLSYRLSHSGSIYSAKFNVSLVALTVITTTVMIVIGNNLALSLGMVGALSIVRFRTAIKDSRDTIYIFWAIVVGICCGAGDYLVAAAGSAVVFLLLLVFGRHADGQPGAADPAHRPGERVPGWSRWSSSTTTGRRSCGPRTPRTRARSTSTSSTGRYLRKPAGRKGGGPEHHGRRLRDRRDRVFQHCDAERRDQRLMNWADGGEGAGDG